MRIDVRLVGPYDEHTYVGEYTFLSDVEHLINAIDLAEDPKPAIIITVSFPSEPSKT